MDIADNVNRIVDTNEFTLYPYGSRIYGTIHVKSDWDFILIMNDARNEKRSRNKFNATLMSPEHFQYLLNEHNLLALECFFVPRQLVNYEFFRSWQFKLDLVKLRHSVAEKSSQSFVKAKKKFISPYEWADDERERGKKSLFHSLRILNFGIQIASKGKIDDFSAANDIYEEVMTNPSKDWEDYQQRWKPEFNRMNTEFRKLAPKE